MAIRTIIEIGDDKLRQHCREVTKFDARLHTLLDDMADTMYHADGVGLAAPQIGILRRICVVDIRESENAKTIYEFINPEIIEKEGCQLGLEGCLSIPGRYGNVKRPQKIKVKAQDRQGNAFELVAEDFLARAICHELDHLDGQLYVDIMENEVFPEDLEEARNKEPRRFRRANREKQE